MDVTVFFNLLDAQLKPGIHRKDTNQLRPHSALGYNAPAEVATMKAGRLMMPLGYQVGADHCSTTIDRFEREPTDPAGWDAYSNLRATSTGNSD